MQKNINRFLQQRYLLTVVVTVVILGAVLWPATKLPDTDLPSIDKVVHFLLFMGWTVAIIYDFNISRWLIALTAGLMFAAFTEAIQIPLDGRSSDLDDLLADGAGVLFGLVNSDWMIRLIRKVLGNAPTKSGK